jgi:hypothetical protein
LMPASGPDAAFSMRFSALCEFKQFGLKILARLVFEMDRHRRREV